MERCAVADVAALDLPQWLCAHEEAVSVTCHIIYLILLFGTISIAAYDFMCPNLRTLAARSGLSANVVGVVFVAFGNSSVDIFGAVAALSKGANALAIGELIGAALFISTVVIGSMALFGPFDVESKFFKRDGRFLLVASVVVMYIIYDGIITLIEVLSLLALYVVYAIVIAMDHFDHTKNQEELYADVARNIGIYHGEIEEAAMTSPMPRSSLLSAHEFHDNLLSPRMSRRSSEPLASPQRAPRCFSEPVVSPASSRPEDETAPLVVKPLPPLTVPPPSSEGLERPELPTLVIESPGNEVDQVPRVHGAPVPPSPTLSTEPSVPHTVLNHMFPSFRGFFDKTWLAQLHSIAMAAPVLCLATTVPVVGDLEVPTAALFVHLACCPIALYMLVAHRMLVLAASAGVLVLLYVAWMRPHSLALTLLGFAMSVVWVVNLAELVINELQAIGVALNISETFMGLTVFAIGDSLGDLVTNISIAQLGMSTMAVSACFAGPFMTMLIGIGIGALVNMVLTGRTVVEMPVDRQIFVAGPLLIAVLIGLQLAVKYNNWQLTPVIGRVLILLWVLSVVVNVSLGYF